ncbi:hypothetical protein HDU76_011533 [Blyttiomyces sp. JEL0837]|nr:hypothetical protein HDU76_011533 [Blyttiomyces sp. JEL0837]
MLGLPSVQWSDSLASLAQSEVNYLSSHNCPNRDLSQGSNEFMVRPATGVADDWCITAIKLWFNEGYDGSYEGLNHASQMSWSTTMEIGCAISASWNGRCASVICHYEPIGNFWGGGGFAPAFDSDLVQ